MSAAADSLVDLHTSLVQATREHEAAPRELLESVAAGLSDVDVDAAGLEPRPLVVMRLLAAGAFDAAWQVLLDNATGVVAERFGASTSSGAARTSRRLSLTTRVEPPAVYAWLPGFRDPRFGAPDAAYDMTSLVTARVRLDELWSDRRWLVLAGSGHLRYLSADPSDVVEVVLTDGAGGRLTASGRRQRRPDLVRGTGGDLTRLAWAGWSARIPVTDLGRAGTWTASLRLTESGITRETPLGRNLGEAVAQRVEARARGRRVRAQITPSRRLTLTTTDVRVLHRIARRALRR